MLRGTDALRLIEFGINCPSFGRSKSLKLIASGIHVTVMSIDVTFSFYLSVYLSLSQNNNTFTVSAFV